MKNQLTNRFVHHVYFWLKSPDRIEDRAALVAGLKALSEIPEIEAFHIGIPAETNRDVIERGYAVSWLCVFASSETEAVYQSHPMHLHFIETCKHLWEKVVVYDAVAVA